MKGYMHIQPVSEIEREIAQRAGGDYGKLEFLLYLAASPEARGWIPLNAAIKQGKILKVSAEKFGISYEASFDTSLANKEGDNGMCEIRGGSLAGAGTFVKVLQQKHSEFKLFFTCHSSYHTGSSLLKWNIGVSDFIDADNLPEEPT